MMIKGRGVCNDSYWLIANCFCQEEGSENFPTSLFHDGCHYHIETSPLIWSANQWSGFFLIGISIMKELRKAISILTLSWWISLSYRNQSIYVKGRLGLLGITQPIRNIFIKERGIYSVRERQGNNRGGSAMSHPYLYFNPFLRNAVKWSDTL